MKTKQPTKDFIYENVNESIIKLLEQGTVPWRMPWSSEFPVNLVSKKEYNGYNWWILMLEQMFKHYDSNVWATFKQITDAGGTVKKGEKSTMVVFWKMMKFESKDKVTRGKNKGKKKIETIPLLRYYNVFNMDQTEGIELKKVAREESVNNDAETIIKKYKEFIEINYGGSRAYYNPSKDYIQIPDRERFHADEHFYATHFHEMVHSTGHDQRLNRGLSVQFASEDYSKEELVAEMGSAYLCAKTGILPKTIENTASYIDGWLKELRNDKTMLVSAGGKAQKAIDFILEPKPKKEKLNEK